MQQNWIKALQNQTCTVQPNKFLDVCYMKRIYESNNNIKIKIIVFQNNHCYLLTAITGIHLSNIFWTLEIIHVYVI